MKFKSPVYSSVSGSIAGLTYAHNRGGLYSRARAVPTNPNSASQQSARNALATLATRWRDTLTTGQRAGWTTYAENTPLTDSLGDPLTLTGQQMYLRCNAPRLRASLAVVDAYPVVFGQADLSLLSVDFNDPDVEITYVNTDDWADDDGALLIQSSRILSPTINFHASPYRFNLKVDGNTAVPPSSPASFIQNAFGMSFTDFPDQRVFFRVRATNPDARLSPVQTLVLDLTS